MGIFRKKNNVQVNAYHPEPIIEQPMITIQQTVELPERQIIRQNVDGLQHSINCVNDLLNGFMTGQLSKKSYGTNRDFGWMVFSDDRAFITVPCTYKETVSFCMLESDRSVNKMDYGGVDIGIIMHHNIKNIEFDKSNNRLSFYGDTYLFRTTHLPDSFTFYLQPATPPQLPTSSVNVDAQIKQLTDGFRKGNLEGWEVDGNIASISLPCFGGYFIFKMFIDNREENILNCRRYDCEFTIHNIIKISKSGERLIFNDGIIDPRIMPNPENFISVVMKKRLYE